MRTPDTAPQVYEPERVVRELYGILNARRFDDFDHLVYRRFEGHGFAEGGRREWKQSLRSLLRAFPDLRISAEDIVSVGDRVVARVTYRGTHQREFAGLKPAGSAMMIAGVDLHHVRDRRIASTWSLIDLLSLVGQLTDKRGNNVTLRPSS